MPLSTSQVHIDRALSNISLFYRNPSYCGDVIAPAVTVAKESDRYFVYGTEHFRIPPALRADKAETSEIAFSLSSDSYLAEEYGYHELVSDRERANSDDALRPDIDATEHLTESLLLDREYRIANTVLDNTNPGWGNWASSHFANLSLAWDNKATADPRGDFYAAKYQIFVDSRRKANTVFLPTEVAYRLAQIEQVDELRKYTDPGLMTDSGLPPKVWGLKVVECESTYDSAGEGTTASFVETWGNNVVFAFINPNPVSLKTLTFALTFQSRPFEVRKWREEKRRSDVLECTHIYDSKIVAPATGFVYTNTITTGAL